MSWNTAPLADVTTPIRRGKRTSHGKLSRDKGHRAALDAFLASVRTGAPALSLRSLVSTTVATFAAMDALRTGLPVEVSPEVDALLGQGT